MKHYLLPIMLFVSFSIQAMPMGAPILKSPGPVVKAKPVKCLDTIKCQRPPI